MGKERDERDNLTLEKLLKVIDPLIKEQRALDKKLLDCFEQIAKDNSIKLGDYIIIHGSWYERFPGPKPMWLKPSYMIKESELILIRGAPIRHNTI